MPKQLQVISNFHSRSLGKDEGIVESGTVLEDVDDTLADQLVRNGWVKVLSSTSAEEAPETATATETTETQGRDDEASKTPAAATTTENVPPPPTANEEDKQPA